MSEKPSDDHKEEANFLQDYHTRNVDMLRYLRVTNLEVTSAVQLTQRINTREQVEQVEVESTSGACENSEFIRKNPVYLHVQVDSGNQESRMFSQYLHSFLYLGNLFAPGFGLLIRITLCRVKDKTTPRKKRKQPTLVEDDTTWALFRVDEKTKEEVMSKDARMGESIFLKVGNFATDIPTTCVENFYVWAMHELCHDNINIGTCFVTNAKVEDGPLEVKVSMQLNQIDRKKGKESCRTLFSTSATTNQVVFCSRLSPEYKERLLDATEARPDGCTQPSASSELLLPFFSWKLNGTGFFERVYKQKDGLIERFCASNNIPCSGHERKHFELASDDPLFGDSYDDDDEKKGEAKTDAGSVKIPPIPVEQLPGMTTRSKAKLKPTQA